MEGHVFSRMFHYEIPEDKPRGMTETKGGVVRRDDFLIPLPAVLIFSNG